MRRTDECLSADLADIRLLACVSYSHVEWQICALKCCPQVLQRNCLSPVFSLWCFVHTGELLQLTGWYRNHRGYNWDFNSRLLWTFTSIPVQSLIFTLVIFHIGTSQHKVPLLLLRSELTAAEFLLFLFNLSRCWLFLVQTRVPLLVTEQAVSQNLMLLW